MIQYGTYEGSGFSVVPGMVLCFLGKGSSVYGICRLLRHMNQSFPK